MSDSVRPHRRQPTRLPRPWDSPGKNTGVGCHFLLQWRKVKSENEVVQSCPTLSDPMDCSPAGSSIHGIVQARVLEWVPSPSPTVLLTIPHQSPIFKFSPLKPPSQPHIPPWPSPVSCDLWGLPVLENTLSSIAYTLPLCWMLFPNLLLSNFVHLWTKITMKQRVSSLHRMFLSYSRILVQKQRGHSSVVEYLTAEGAWQQTGVKQLRKKCEGHHRQGREFARHRDA